MSETYKSAGVDIEAGEKTVESIKPYIKQTMNKNVLSEVGLFGGFYDASFPDYEHPVLVSSTDGVGTKLKVAFMTDKHDTVGQCLVNHCTNDILAGGATPLFFLDYFATGKLIPEVASDVIKGFAIACKENDCVLIGGETAEMPGFYNENEYDMSGTIVGVVDKKNIINGSEIRKGDLLIGLKSTGLHTNGYSLARKVLFPKFDINDTPDGMNETIGGALLQIHKSYLKNVKPLIENQLLTGISHITGGGIIGNTSRILPKECQLEIDWNSWETLPIFDLIQKTGNISDDEMRKAFNLGIGMILISRPENVDKIMSNCESDNPLIIGKVV
ncbi:MAG: phosphoribosylformylglycinamidine cyclo-ligase [Ignavibacteriae bacterium]|nr:phosphoribosylformylglycinamidine cyclo-ligase [Ignavibacteriota bacterium]MCB9220959.1 phosphoribosylformylglycinamidine cyclo-ligase [Ignavibacteria bacterium]